MTPETYYEICTRSAAAAEDTNDCSVRAVAALLVQDGFDPEKALEAVRALAYEHKWREPRDGMYLSHALRLLKLIGYEPVKLRRFAKTAASLHRQSGEKRLFVSLTRHFATWTQDGYWDWMQTKSRKRIDAIYRIQGQPNALIKIKAGVRDEAITQQIELFGEAA